MMKHTFLVFGIALMTVGQMASAHIVTYSNAQVLAKTLTSETYEKFAKEARTVSHGKFSLHKNGEIVSIALNTKSLGGLAKAYTAKLIYRVKLDHAMVECQTRLVTGYKVEKHSSGVDVSELQEPLIDTLDCK